MAVFFLVLLAADIFSTLASGELVQFLEANPLFKHFGYFGILLINLFWIGVMYKLYTWSNKPMWRWVWISTVVTICVLRVLIVYNNVGVAMNPPPIEVARAVTPAMKRAVLFKLGGLAVLPYFISYLSYVFFKIDHRIGVKHE